MGPAKSSTVERGEERRGEKGWEAAEWPRAGRVETEFRKSSKKPEAVSCCYAATIDHLGGRRASENGYVAVRLFDRGPPGTASIACSVSFARQPMAVPCSRHASRDRYRQRSTTSRLSVAFRDPPRQPYRLSDVDRSFAGAE